jgi:molybdopterin molybdotransferase
MSQAVSKLDSQDFKLDVVQAQQRIWQDCTPISGYQKVNLREALHRVLAESIQSPIDVPAHTNSAVDGYAIQHLDIPAEGTRWLQVIGTAFAGAPFTGTLQRGQALRIMTGAVIPDGADCVIMQERVQLKQDQVEIGSQHKQHENVRRVGEDLAAGQPALAQGKRLQPADLGLLASLGINEIRVRRRLRVAFFSTGDELCSLGQPLAPGQIYDSNRYTLLGMLKALDLDVIDLGVVADEPQRLRQTLLTAAEEADAIITTGGVSVGEADYMREIMQSLGSMHFWQIAMKPGRPLAYGRIAYTPLFGLPGNPVAVMVTFYQFVQPALLKLSGVSGVQAPACFRVRSASAFRKLPGRTEYQRAILFHDEHGELCVRSFGKQGSGILRSMSEANCLVVLGKDSEAVQEGDWVEVQPFEGLLS